MRFSNENKLLIDCLRPAPDEQTARRIRDALAGELDWGYILQSARENNVAAPLYYGLKKIAGKEAVPSDAWEELTKAYHQVGFRNTLFFDELKRVLRSFRSLNIEAIVLKGAALANDVWDNVALREMADIDLFVREEDLERTDEALSDLGYISNEHYRTREWYRENHHHLAPYFNPARGFAIEIHHRLGYPRRKYRVGVDRAWERARTIRLGDVNARILSPEDQIVHLCLHLSDFDHFIGKIKNLIDIGKIIAHYGPDIDWTLVASESKEGGFARLLYYSLFFTEDILGLEIEKQIMEELKNTCELSFFEDRLLKLTVRRAILFTDAPSRLFPKWTLRSVCRQLLRKLDTHGENGSLLKALTGPSGTQGPHSDSASLPKSAHLCYPIIGFLKLILRAGGVAIRVISHRVGATFAR